MTQCQCLGSAGTMNTARCHLVRDIVGYETVIAVLNLPAVPKVGETVWVTPKTGEPNRYIVNAIGYHGKDIQGESVGVAESYVIVEVADPPRK